MVEIPDTDDVTDSVFSSAKAAGGALIGMQAGQQFLPQQRTLGAAIGGVGGALVTGKSTENKAAATMVMASVLPRLMNGGLNFGGGSSQSQQQSAGAPASI